MGHIQSVHNWHASDACGGAYEKLLRALGTDEFGATAREAVLSLTDGLRRLYLFEIQGKDNAELRYWSAEPGLDELIPIYQKCYLPVDPVHEACRAAPAKSDMALQRVRPIDIAQANFRRRFFDQPGIIERVSIVQHADEGWRVMNLARHESDGCFSDREIDALVGLACLVLPMLPLARGKVATARQLSVVQLEERFAGRYPALTNRERQVCARAAIGMTVEATALDLGIAKTSVLTYRQRAYQRLSITSPFELSSLVTH